MTHSEDIRSTCVANSIKHLEGWREEHLPANDLLGVSCWDHLQIDQRWLQTSLTENCLHLLGAAEIKELNSGVAEMG